SILYDNTKLAVARILGDGVRQRTRVFSELQSHYVFAEKFGRPGKGNDKGKVEGLIGWIRPNLLVPVPRPVPCTPLTHQLLLNSLGKNPRQFAAVFAATRGGREAFGVLAHALRHDFVSLFIADMGGGVAAPFLLLNLYAMANNL